MIVPELLLAAAAEVREADRAQLAEAASHTAYLLGVLGQVGTDLGLRPTPRGHERPAGPAPVVAPDPRPRRAT